MATSTNEKLGTLIKNVHVIDSFNLFDSKINIFIAEGIITDIGTDIKLPQEYIVYDGTGLYASAGWIDFHTHVYQYATELGVNVDDTCLYKGVTTVVDAGSSGSSTFDGLKNYVIDQSITRVKALLHIANHGLASATCTGETTGGESDSLNQLNTKSCIECIQKNSEHIVGVKIRLSESCCNDGRNEVEAFKRALHVSKTVNKPLMVHHAISTIPPNQASEDSLGCPGSLRTGDVYTHMYHSYIIEDGKVSEVFKEARKRGVLLDVGHGMGSFNWKHAEICAKESFFPDIISTDLHTFSSQGPAYDLATIMSKLLHTGMNLHKVIEAVTHTPAKAMSLEHEVGSLAKGRMADITVFKIVDTNVKMEDCFGDDRTMEQIVVPVDVWREGVKYKCK